VVKREPSGRELTHGHIERMNQYTMMEDPQTSCGCFECIVAINSDLQGVIVVNREYTGMTPNRHEVLNARRVCRWGAIKRPDSLASAGSSLRVRSLSARMGGWRALFGCRKT